MDEAGESRLTKADVRIHEYDEITFNKCRKRRKISL
jgi:hypothetical protein